MKTGVNLREKLAKLEAARGPLLQEVDVTVGNATVSFWFRKIPYIELDRIRTKMFGSGGSFEPERAAGQKARFVAKTLCDDEGNLFYDSPEGLDELYMLGEATIDALHDAAEKVNASSTIKREEVAKNSETVANDSSS